MTHISFADSKDELEQSMPLLQVNPDTTGALGKPQSSTSVTKGKKKNPEKAAKKAAELAAAEALAWTLLGKQQPVAATDGQDSYNQLQENMPAKRQVKATHKKAAMQTVAGQKRKSQLALDKSTKKGKAAEATSIMRSDMLQMLPAQNRCFQPKATTEASTQATAPCSSCSNLKETIANLTSRMEDMAAAVEAKKAQIAFLERENAKLNLQPVSHRGLNLNSKIN